MEAVGHKGAFDYVQDLGYPPIDIKFTNRIAYYNAFDEYQVKHNLDVMEKLFARYVYESLENYLKILEK